MDEVRLGYLAVSRCLTIGAVAVVAALCLHPRQSSDSIVHMSRADYNLGARLLDRQLQPPVPEQPDNSNADGLAVSGQARMLPSRRRLGNRSHIRRKQRSQL